MCMLADSCRVRNVALITKLMIMEYALNVVRDIYTAILANGSGICVRAVIKAQKIV